MLWLLAISTNVDVPKVPPCGACQGFEDPKENRTILPWEIGTTVMLCWSEWCAFIKQTGPFKKSLQPYRSMDQYSITKATASYVDILYGYFALTLRCNPEVFLRITGSNIYWHGYDRLMLPFTGTSLWKQLAHGQHSSKGGLNFQTINHILPLCMA